MVDVKTQTAVNPRTAIREARQRRLRVVASGPATVKVYAASEDIKDFIRHSNGTRFRDDGSAEWPDDSFTARRIAEGAVRTDGPAQHHPELVLDESLNPRQHAAAVTAARAIVEQAKDAPKPAPKPAA